MGESDIRIEYSEGRISIDADAEHDGEYNLWIGARDEDEMSVHYHLKLAEMQDLAKTPLSGLVGKLAKINPNATKLLTSMKYMVNRMDLHGALTEVVLNVEGRRARVVGEEERYLLSEGVNCGGYNLHVGRDESKGERGIFYHLIPRDFDRLANTDVAKLEAELNRISPAMAERLKGCRVNWEDLSMFLGRCAVDEEDRNKQPRKEPPYDAATFSKIMKEGRTAINKANEDKILGPGDFR